MENTSNVTDNATVVLSGSTEMLTQDSVKKERVLSIDRIRGLCMFAMACSFFCGLFADAFAPLMPLIEHFPGDPEKIFLVLPGMSFADMFAPTFIFVIGLSMVYSYRSRVAKVGETKALNQLAERFVDIVGLGYCIGGLEEGWSQVISKDIATIKELQPSARIAAVFFVLQCCLVGVLIFTKFFKSDKIRGFGEKLFRLSLTVAGIWAIYFGLASAGAQFGGEEIYGRMWDTLYNIGFSCLIAVPFIKFGVKNRMIIVSFMFLVQTVLYKHGLFGFANRIIEGGVIGAFGWAQIAILGTIFSDLKDDKRYWIYSACVLLTSVIFIFSFENVVAKRGCTPVYAWFTAGVASMIWGGLNFLNNWKPKFDFFKIWGSNAILSYVSIYILQLIIGMFAEEEAAHMIAGGAVPIVLLILAVYTVVLYVMDRKKVFIRI